MKRLYIIGVESVLVQMIDRSEIDLVRHLVQLTRIRYQYLYARVGLFVPSLQPACYLQRRQYKQVVKLTEPCLVQSANRKPPRTDVRIIYKIAVHSIAHMQVQFLGNRLTDNHFLSALRQLAFHDIPAKEIPIIRSFQYDPLKRTVGFEHTGLGDERRHLRHMRITGQLGQK